MDTNIFVLIYFDYREVPVDATVNKESCGHRPFQPMAAPVSGAIFQAR